MWFVENCSNAAAAKTTIITATTTIPTKATTNSTLWVFHASWTGVFSLVSEKKQVSSGLLDSY